MDKRKNTVSCCSKKLDGGQNLNFGSKENLKRVKEARNRCQEAGGPYISESRVGIVGKGKVQENVRDNVEILSIDSRAVQTPCQRITAIPGKVSGQSDSSYTKSLGHHSLPSPSVRQILKSSLTGTQEAAVSEHTNKTGSLKNKNLSETSTKKLLGKSAMRDDNIKLGVNKSDWENSSALESAVTNKLQDGKVLNRKTVCCSKRGQDGVHFVDSPSIQKKKAKIVSTSCMQSSLHKTGSQTNILPRNSRTKQCHSRPHSRPCSTITTSHREKQELIEDLMTEKTAAGMVTNTTNTTCITNKSDFPMTTENYEMPQPVIDLFIPIVKFSQFINVELKVCTPSQDQPWHSFSPTGDSSTILNKKNTNTNLQADVPCTENIVTNILSEEHSSEKRGELRNEVNNINTVETAQFEIDLDYTRSLPVTFLNSKTKEECPDVGREAFGNRMWQLLESEKDHCDQHVSDAARSERSLLDNILGRTRLDLESLALLDTHVDEGFTGASSLDETEHHLTTKDFHIPKQSEEHDLYSEKLERALRESEHLLAELSFLTDDTMHSTPSQFLGNARDLGRNVSVSHRDLRKCPKDLNLFMS